MLWSFRVSKINKKRVNRTRWMFFVYCLFFVHCGATPSLTSLSLNLTASTLNTQTSLSMTQTALEQSLVQSLISFDVNDYDFMISDSLPNVNAIGNLLNYSDSVSIETDYWPTPSPLPSNLMTLIGTLKPSFIKNISVDIVSSLIPVPSSTPTPTASVGLCALFDSDPTTFYGTGKYIILNDNCLGNGLLFNNDAHLSGLSIGGVYIDIDRTKLGIYENLLLNLTWIPLSDYYDTPSNGSYGSLPHLSSTDSAFFKIHLIKTGLTEAFLKQDITQPRTLFFADSIQYPKIIENFELLSTFPNQMRQDQIYLPISIDLGIDQIHIERYSGSAIFIQMSLLRLRQDE